MPYWDQSDKSSELSTLQENTIRWLSDAEYIEIKIFTKWYLGSEKLRSSNILWDGPCNSKTFDKGNHSV